MQETDKQAEVDAVMRQLAVQEEGAGDDKQAEVDEVMRQLAEYKKKARR